MPTGPDVLFDTYPFAAGASPYITRTMQQRINDFPNVREFGTIGTETQTTAMIQAAVNSGLSFWFPAGRYLINAPILFPNDGKQRKIVGPGWYNPVTGGGATIEADGVGINDYIFKGNPTGGHGPLNVIDGLGFINRYVRTGGNSSITSADPPGTGISGADGCGCIYMPNCTNLRVTNIVMGVTSGIGLYFPGINNYVSNFNISGNFGNPLPPSGGTGSDAKQLDACPTIGIWGTSCYIGDGKPFGCRIAVVVCQGPAVLSNMDIEVSQYGIVTHNPLTFWDRNSNAVQGVGSNNMTNLTATALNFESCGSVSQGGASILLNIMDGADFSNIVCNHHDQIGPATNGITIVNSKNCIFRNMNITGSGTFTNAGIAITATGAHDNNSFYNCVATGASGTGNLWDIGPINTKNPGVKGPRLYGCNHDGSRTMAQLPASPAIWGCDEQVVSNASQSFPANIGQQLNTTTTGSNKVKVRAQPVADIVASGTWPPGDGNFQTITMSVVNPGNIYPGMGVWDVNKDHILGTVHTWTAGTPLLVLKENGAYTTSASSADTLRFMGWVIIG